METAVCSGKYHWTQPSAGVQMRPAAVAVGPQDQVYCANWVAEHPVEAWSAS